MEQLLRGGDLAVLPAKPALLTPQAARRIRDYGERLTVTLVDTVAPPLLKLTSAKTVGFA